MTDAATTLFTSASLIVAFFAGAIMLFAPCCITLMLPAYLGSVFKEKSKVLLMTLIFAAGVASIMLPIVLGARFLASFFSAYHTMVFAFGSLLMIGVGLLSLFDKTIPLPFASGLRAPRATNAATAYLLGVVSGISSSCCAPVLLAALALAAISPNLVQAAGVGLAYTFGIVFPLLLISLFLESGLAKRLMRWRQRTVTLGSRRRPLSQILSFVIFTATGAFFLVLALTNRLQMDEGTVGFSIQAKALVDRITQPLLRLPGSDAIFGLLLVGLLLVFVLRAWDRGKETGAPERDPKHSSHHTPERNL